MRDAGWAACVPVRQVPVRRRPQASEKRHLNKKSRVKNEVNLVIRRVLHSSFCIRHYRVPCPAPAELRQPPTTRPRAARRWAAGPPLACASCRLARIRSSDYVNYRTIEPGWSATHPMSMSLSVAAEASRLGKVGRGSIPAQGVKPTGSYLDVLWPEE